VEWDIWNNPVALLIFGLQIPGHSPGITWQGRRRNRLAKSGRAAPRM